MSTLHGLTIIAALAGTLSLSVSNSYAAKPLDNVQAATPLSNAEIYRLYSYKSWLWRDGAGYFAVPKRQFKAWSGTGNKATFAEGIWFITEPGKLCFRANWYHKNSVSPATTCFSHRQKDGVIYQKREPQGEWYIFKHSPTQKNDEIRKLRRGDYVSKRLDALKMDQKEN